MAALISYWDYWHGAASRLFKHDLLYGLCSALAFAVYTGYLTNGISLLCRAAVRMLLIGLPILLAQAWQHF